MKVSRISWEEPNRAKSLPLHIASRGERYSTLTGVWWIDEYRFLVNHRDGLRLALFDVRRAGYPLVIVPIPHLSDDVAAKKIDKALWEIAVSGCWDASYSIYHLSIGDEVKIQFVSTQPLKDKTFCHGVAYDDFGNLCLAYHTGKNPRIEIGNKTWVIPQPWGVRDVCFDIDNYRYYAVAVSANPQRSEYAKTSTSIWTKHLESDEWHIIKMIDDMHSDACQIYHGRLWLPDQKGDRIVGVSLSLEKKDVVIKGACFDFPHGLSISKKGILAITNYGSSDVVIMDLSEL